MWVCVSIYLSIWSQYDLTLQGGSGYAKNILFQNIVMHNVSNPIIIDQNYCDQNKPCNEQVIENFKSKHLKNPQKYNAKLDFNASIPENICRSWPFYIFQWQGGSAVKVQNVWYKNIKGTSASEIAIQLDCSKSFPCKGIVLQDINLASDSSDGQPKASCINVDGLSSWGKVSPPCWSWKETKKKYIHICVNMNYSWWVLLNFIEIYLTHVLEWVMVN